MEKWKSNEMVQEMLKEREDINLKNIKKVGT